MASPEGRPGGNRASIAGGRDDIRLQRFESHRDREEDGRGDGPHLLRRAPRRRRCALRDVCDAAALLARPPRRVPVRRRQTDVQGLPDSLLQARRARGHARGDAVRRPSDDAAPPVALARPPLEGAVSQDAEAKKQEVKKTEDRRQKTEDRRQHLPCDSDWSSPGRPITCRDCLAEAPPRSWPGDARAKAGESRVPALIRRLAPSPGR